jgi:hypothetical protein
MVLVSGIFFYSKEEEIMWRPRPSVRTSIRLSMYPFLRVLSAETFVRFS